MDDKITSCSGEKLSNGKDNGEVTENAVASGASLKNEKAKSTASYIAKTAMFTALAFLFHLIRIPMPVLFAPWLELHISDIPALIGGFALGPVAGCVITSLRVLLKLLFQGTSSGFVGDVGDLIIGISLVLPASLIYRFNKNKKGALLGIIVGSVLSVLSAMLVNRFMLIPFYSNVMGFSKLVELLSAIFSNVNESNFYAYYIWLSVLPFNVLRCVCVGLVTFLVYKRVSKILKMF